MKASGHEHPTFKSDIGTPLKRAGIALYNSTTESYPYLTKQRQIRDWLNAARNEPRLAAPTRPGSDDGSITYSVLAVRRVPPGSRVATLPAAPARRRHHQCPSGR